MNLTGKPQIILRNLLLTLVIYTAMFLNANQTLIPNLSLLKLLKYTYFNYGLLNP